MNPISCCIVPNALAELWQLAGNGCEPSASPDVISGSRCENGNEGKCMNGKWDEVRKTPRQFMSRLPYKPPLGYPGKTVEKDGASIREFDAAVR